MQNDKIVTISGRGVPVRGNDIDTDRIIPARFLKSIVFDGLGAHAFADDRIGTKAAGGLHPFDDPRFAGASILLANKNFGCGSSREHAPQALKRWGVQAVVGVSYAEIFRGNCQAIGVPVCVVSEAAAQALQEAVEAKPQAKVTVDLEKREVRLGKQAWPLEMPDGVRQAFLEGTWDPTAELLSAKAKIEAVAAALPYFRNWKDSLPAIVATVPAVAVEPVAVAAIPVPAAESAGAASPAAPVVKKPRSKPAVDKAGKAKAPAKKPVPKPASGTGKPTSRSKARTK